jgi:hypothetical protein
MKKIKYALALLAIIGLSSCGIFKKDCGCPHFGKIKTVTKTAPIARYV